MFVGVCVCVCVCVCMCVCVCVCMYQNVKGPSCYATLVLTVLNHVCVSGHSKIILPFTIKQISGNLFYEISQK